MNIFDFKNKKIAKEKISFITCYDYTSACLLAKTNIDGILVGDSLAMTMHGYKDTLSATMEMMCLHTAAVSRGASHKFILADLPFLSYRLSLNKSVKAVQALMQAGAHAVKLEGAEGNIKLIRHLVASGVPVMGHLGLTPQSIHALGGYKVQGKTEERAMRLKNEAMDLQQAGCFGLLLEGIPQLLAKEITEELAIPTIGIGAGSFTDGQILVFQDLLGLNTQFKPKFVKVFADVGAGIQSGVEAYIHSVKTGEFPQHEHSYHN